MAFNTPTVSAELPEALPDPNPDQLRAIARTARNSSGSASDDCGPLAYVLYGWRAAAIAFRAQQPAPSAAAAVEWIGVSSHHLLQRDGILGKAGDVVTARWPVLPQPSPTPQADTEAFQNFHRLLCARFGYVHDERDWRRDQLSLVEHIARQAQPSPTPQADSQPAMTPETVYAAIAHGDQDHRAWLLSALRAVWCGEAVPPVASPIADAAAESQPEPVREHDLRDVRCECCGYMTYHLEHTGCIRAARAPAESVTAPGGGVVAAGRFMDEAAERRSAQEGYENRIKRVSERNPQDEGMYSLGWWDRAWKAAAPTPPAQAADSVLEDAERWQWLADYLIGERTDLDEGIVACATIDALRQFADAARKQGANHD